MGSRNSFDHNTWLIFTEMISISKKKKKKKFSAIIQHFVLYVSYLFINILPIPLVKTAELICLDVELLSTDHKMLVTLI